VRPGEKRDSGQSDLLRSRLDQIVKMDHALAKLAGTIDWRFLEEKFGAVYSANTNTCRATTSLGKSADSAFFTDDCRDPVVGGTAHPGSFGDDIFRSLSTRKVNPDEISWLKQAQSLDQSSRNAAVNPADKFISKLR
jgi:hypothetical protein